MNPMMGINPRHRRSPRNLQINQAFPDWDDGEGIFSIIGDNTTLPWSSSVNLTSLDVAYHGIRSGDKFCAPIVYRYLDDDGEITSTGKTKLQSAILGMFLQKWTHLWSIYTKQYDPLHTYSITETGEDERTTDTDSTNTNTKDLTTTDVVDTDTSDTRTPNLTDATTNKVYGFNSSTSVNQSESTTTHTGTEGNVGSVDTTDTVTQEGTDTLVIDKTVDESGSYTKTRTGNVYRAPAELLSFDREFWLVDYFSIIFKDIDEVIALAIYSENDPNYTIF